MSRLLASLAEDFDTEVAERTPDRARVTLRVSAGQRQAAMTRVIGARADLSGATLGGTLAADSAALDT